MPPSLTFTPDAWKTLQTQAEAAYPFEGCGLLLGPLSAEKTVTKISALKNTLREEGRGRFDFTFSPQEFMAVQLAAEREGLDVVGLYHTHPDHPARPSKTDEGQPMLSGWINVIASVHGGKFKEARAWWREEDRDPFQETLLRPGVGSVI
jgi:proteasome lid subunit RPN8/RPN11